MKRATLLLLALGLFLALAAPATAQSNCTFTLGFKNLHDMIPTNVGDCIENEGHNPQNGDGLQRTSGGLLVWRKADNWTAFTDGYRTWINGPNGLQQRLNTERFPWEADAASAPAAGPAPAAPPPAPVAAPSEVGLNQTVNVGDWAFSVFDVKKEKAVYFYSDSYVAKGTFLLVFVRSKNNGPGTDYVGTLRFRLRDSADRSYDEASSGTWRASWQFSKDSVFTNTNPGITREVVIAFDVPLDAGGFVLVPTKVGRPSIRLGI